jgi:predicted Zn-dependent protease
VARLEAEGLALVARDDRASLDAAEQLMRAALRADPGFHQARADLALVELLLAAARRDEASRLASPEGDELMRSGRDLRERALDELRPLVRKHRRDPSVLRALAVYYGLDGDAPQAAKVIAEARAAGSDPWVDLAELASDLRSGGTEAVTRLGAFVSSHPGLLRARMMLARALLDRSRQDDSLRALDDLLAANPNHEHALRLKASILSPPPARLATVPLPSAAPPPQRPGYLPRKRASGGAPRQRQVSP